MAAAVNYLKIFIGLTFVLAMCAMPPACAQDESIGWLTDLNEAKRRAAAENKLVLLHFWGAFCRPCLNLEKFVFTNPRVGAAINEHYVPVKIDVEAQPGLAKQFGITTIPHDVMILPDGRVVAKQASSSNSDGYLRMVQLVAQQAARTDPQTFSAAQQIAQAASDFGQVSKAYVPAGQSLATPESIQMIANSAPAEVPMIKTVAGQVIAPVAKDERNFAFPKQAEPDLSETQTKDSDTNAPPAPPTTIAGAKLADSPKLGLSMQTLRPFDEDYKQAIAAANSLHEAPTQFIFNEPAAASPLTVKMPPAAAAGPSPVLANASSKSPAAISLPSPGWPTKTPVSNASATLAKPQVGFGGFCPTTWFVTDQFVVGNAIWSCEHRGRLYWFASRQLLDQFRLTPDVLSPMLAGYDPVTYATVGTLVAGSLEHHAIVETDQVKAIYLFSSAANKSAFESDRQKFIDEVRQAMRAADSTK